MKLLGNVSEIVRVVISKDPNVRRRLMKRKNFEDIMFPPLYIFSYGLYFE